MAPESTPTSAGSLPPNPGTYDRGFKTGCLLGCSPIILLLLLFLVATIWSAVTRRSHRTDIIRTEPLPPVDATQPASTLLPIPPKTDSAPLYLGDDLSHVPELMLESAPKLTREEWASRKARTAAAALHLNGKEQDAFLKAVRGSRPDLAGLPFAMGAACRTTGASAKAFKEAAESVRREKAAALLDATGPDAGEERERFYQAHLAVVAQVIPAEDFAHQRALVLALTSVPRPEATRALARLAVFATDKGTRTAAVKALAVRREGGWEDVVVSGLSYPWPAVAENAAAAIAALKRKDLASHLRTALDAPDPRGPRTEVVDGRKETVAYELVRVNHLRNCLLCHAPAERGATPTEALVAEVPVPTMPVPDTRSGYGQSGSNLLVRIDVTYLRHDFSAVQMVNDWTAEAWGAKQRFDFLLRRRVLTPNEEADLRTRLGGESPYRRAAAQALHELTGHGAEAEGGAASGPPKTGD
jgi:hypothetical protein